MGTAFDGSLPLALEPSLLQKLDEPSPLTSANLNSAAPLKLTPSTATRPWKLISCGTWAQSWFSVERQTVKSSKRAILINSVPRRSWLIELTSRTNQNAGRSRTVLLAAHPVRLSAHATSDKMRQA